MSRSELIPALGYDFLTPWYDTVVGLFLRENTFKNALVHQAAIKPGQKVLDLACGTGTLTIMLKKAERDAEVMGIDGDARIIELARQKAREKEIDLEFDSTMSFDLPYPDKTFDRVVSSLLFHHLTRNDKLKTLDEVKRVLKNDGELHIADWGKASNAITALAAFSIKLLDGFDTTSDNFDGLLPVLIKEVGIGPIEETGWYDTVFGTIRLYKIVVT